MKINTYRKTRYILLSIGFGLLPVRFEAAEPSGAKYSQAAVLSGFGQAEEDDPQHSLNSRGQGERH